MSDKLYSGSHRLKNKMNCPIIEVTGDGRPVGRCWFYLPDGKTCPRHGDVLKAVELFEMTGKLTLEKVN